MTCVDSLPVCVQIQFSVEMNTFHMVVDGKRVTDGQLPNSEGSHLDLRSPVYMGSDHLSQIEMVCIKACDCVTYYLTAMSHYLN